VLRPVPPVTRLSPAALPARSAATRPRASLPRRPSRAISLRAALPVPALRHRTGRAGRCFRSARSRSAVRAPRLPCAALPCCAAAASVAFSSMRSRAAASRSALLCASSRREAACVAASSATLRASGSRADRSICARSLAASPLRHRLATGRALWLQFLLGIVPCLRPASAFASTSSCSWSRIRPCVRLRFALRLPPALVSATRGRFRRGCRLAFGTGTRFGLGRRRALDDALARNRGGFGVDPRAQRPRFPIPAPRRASRACAARGLGFARRPG
jgi:hypothetical protein